MKGDFNAARVNILQLRGITQPIFPSILRSLHENVVVAVAAVCAIWLLREVQIGLNLQPVQPRKST